MTSYLDIAKRALQQHKTRVKEGKTCGTNNEFNESNEITQVRQPRILDLLKHSQAPRCDCETWHGPTILGAACPECLGSNLCGMCGGCRWCWFQDVRSGRLST